MARCDAWEMTSRNEEETRSLGARLGRRLERGDVVALFGPVGAGKTVFAQGVLTGLGAPGPHPSPSFQLVRVHRGRVPAYHVDAYRLGPGAPREDVGWEELFGGEGVAVVEWAEHLLPRLPADRLEVRLDRDPQGPAEVRRIRLCAGGPRSRLVLADLVAEVGHAGGGH
jgi:tRNA threonylcarbamoyladenosine biosynthesis protein TsaE